MRDNVIPYIGGEEEKSEREPLRIWGKVEGGVIVPAEAPVISAQCIRVPVSDGHMAAVSVSFDKPPERDEILERWANWTTEAQRLELPSAPTPFLKYFEEDNRPQTRLDRDFERGMGRALPLAVCARIQYSIISLWRWRTTRCAARRAAAY